MPRFIDISGTPPIAAADEVREAFGATSIGSAVFTAADAPAARAELGCGPVLNVVDYGADPTGVADSAAAFQNAIDAAGALTGGANVIVPTGIYTIGTGLVFDTSSTGMIGQGETISRLNFTGSTTNAITCTASGDITLANLNISKASGTTTNGIVFNYTASATTNYKNTIRKVDISGFTTGNGLDFSGLESSLFDAVTITNCNFGFYATTNPSGGGAANNNIFTRCRASSCVGAGWNVNYVEATQFLNCQGLNSGPGSAGYPQFAMGSGCRANTVVGLDVENPNGTPSKGLGINVGGSEHVVSVTSYGLDTGVQLNAATGCTVMPGKYAVVTTPVNIVAGSTKCSVVDPNIAVTDNSTAGTNFIVSSAGVKMKSPRIISGNAPASAAATGVAGQVEWDTSYIYVCTATNTWKRAAISTW